MTSGVGNGWRGFWWTQTGSCIGMIPDSQMKSIAAVVTRTQPCEAG